ncbi:MAG: Spore protein SP21 [Anaerolineales bacterium]|nr:Spore protein SP21 [Anaerolineales bacterium]
MSLSRWDPFREMVSLREAMDRLFEESFVRPSRGEGALTVPVDMYETDEDIVVSAAVPGLKPEDVDINITGSTLTLKGGFRSEEEGERGDVHFQERRYGKFQRSMSLPANISIEEVDAVFEGGVLKITLPKAEEAKPKQIPVTVKK